MRAFEYRHVVGFEETNVVGNVYFVNHMRWMGRCREMFLRDRAPEIFEAMEHGQTFATLDVSCEYLSELTALSEICVRMYLGDLVQNRVTMIFEFWHETQGEQLLFARGRMKLAWIQRQDGEFLPSRLPSGFIRAAEDYRYGAHRTTH